MKRFSVHDVFYINRFTKEGSHHDYDYRNYFEIIFIEEGYGKHHINEFIISYEKGDIFLIAPGDTHHFLMESKTSFSYFQFSDLLFSNKTNLPDRTQWLNRIERIIHNPNLLPGDLIKEKNDRELVWLIHKGILYEYNNQKQFFRHNISNMVSTILSIIARNIHDGLNVDPSGIKDNHTAISDILSYIRQHIYDKNRIKINAIAGQFNMSNNTISAYFKKKTGKSLHNYIVLYKIQLVKYRLEHSDFTVSEIAYQLGFTDESHLTRIFKKYVSSTPKKYRLLKQIENSKKETPSF